MILPEGAENVLDITVSMTCRNTSLSALAWGSHKNSVNHAVGIEEPAFFFFFFNNLKPHAALEKLMTDWVNGSC